MTKAIDPSVMGRLVLVRQLFLLGREQSNAGEPVLSIAVLTLHDAVEMFLQAAAEHCEIPLKKNPDFMDYWAPFAAAGKALGFNVPMARLNRARVGLKHSGLLPHNAEVQGFVATVADFFETNCSDLIGVEFDAISLSGLIRSGVVRAHVVRGEAAIADGDIAEALSAAAQAFRAALREHRYGDTTRGETRVRLYEPSAAARSRLWHRSSRRDQTIEAIEGMADELGEAITVIGYNLDFDGYCYFRTHSPVVIDLIGGETVVQWTHEPPKEPEAASRSLRFVAEAALRMERRHLLT